MITIVDFGSQYTQLIARRVRGMGVYSRIVSCREKPAEILRDNPKGIILSGGPASLYEKGAPRITKGFIEKVSVPILGICYGHQALMHALGGKVEQGGSGEYGRAEIEIGKDDPLVKTVAKQHCVWMSHRDHVAKLPTGFTRVASSPATPNAVVADHKRRIWGLQFHPEVHHTEHGPAYLENFVYRICECTRDWSLGDWIESTCEQIREQAAGRRVISAVSGGVDSTVMGVLLDRALGKDAVPVFVDNGLLRQNEAAEVQHMLGTVLGLNLKTIRASKHFLDHLKGVTEPEKKRKVIGREFIKVFFKNVKTKDMLAQGTLYPDVIESVAVRGPSDKIKTHHNRVPEVMKLIEQGRVIEPLCELFKDEVREVGRLLEIPDPILQRYPFPGPGLAIRILGEVNAKGLKLLRAADQIFRDEIAASADFGRVWQGFAVLLPVKAVGVMGDRRTYAQVICIRCVESVDGMTADWARLDYGLLDRISRRIVNEIDGINRVVYDITSKPPGTIEWE